jgi:hypothetical protein
MEVKCGALASAVPDEEWAFVLPYLLLFREDAGQRQHSIGECLARWVG